jgi:hypothetical protein
MCRVIIRAQARDGPDPVPVGSPSAALGDLLSEFNNSEFLNVKQEQFEGTTPFGDSAGPFSFQDAGTFTRWWDCQVRSDRASSEFLRAEGGGAKSSASSLPLQMPIFWPCSKSWRRSLWGRPPGSR